MSINRSDLPSWIQLDSGEKHTQQTSMSGLIIHRIEADSPAAAAGLRPGDIILSINGRLIMDVLDYRYYSHDSMLSVQLLRGASRVTVEIEKLPGTDLGLRFEQDLADSIYVCNNQCVFCFIHQMPKRMRRSLYLKDDDFRLSFLHGNYMTLTNLSQGEYNRIKEQRLSPLYVSVHATDPAIRGQLLGKKGSAPILPQLDDLRRSHIDVHAQIVLCPGINDGVVLEETLDELAARHPSLSENESQDSADRDEFYPYTRSHGVLSVAVVPVGLTKFREKLPKLKAGNADYARRMIRNVHGRQMKYLRELGTSFVWLSDEWYVMAGRSVPGIRHYERFPQYEDGVGTIRLFKERQRTLARRLPDKMTGSYRATVVTGELAAPALADFIGQLNRISGLQLNLCVVKNEFFGGGINVTGLLTATDILAQLQRFPVLGEVIIPSICLRDEYLFLDDVTVSELSQNLDRPVRVVGISPHDLAANLGLITMRSTHHPGREWLMEAVESNDAMDPAAETTTVAAAW